MSIRVLTRVWANSKASGGDLLVLLAIADHANDSGEAWPSVPVLAQRSRLSDRQTRRVLGRLEESGELKRIRSNGGRNRSNRYQILIEENPDKITMTKLPCKNNSDICDTKTLTLATKNPVTDDRGIKPSITISEPSHSELTLPIGQTDRSSRPPTKLKATASRIAKRQSDPRVKNLIGAFNQRYQTRVGESYAVNWAKDGNLLKSFLAKGKAEEQITAAMDLYFNDPWAAKCGFNIPSFISQYAKIVSAQQVSPNSTRVAAMPGKYSHL